MNMSIIVYWITKPTGEGMFPGFSEPKCKPFAMSQMSEALTFCNEQRNAGMRHVSMSVENSDMVGELGVKAFDGFQADGVTPYDWSKQHRGAGPSSTERK